ncbi:CAP domain-containing protein [Streptomyces syringium]|uniref:CAP domain-containing protein n=1 Tax=Streptomyces syringium TaxID=76729 RepID=UPI0034065CE6
MGDPRHPTTRLFAGRRMILYTAIIITGFTALAWNMNVLQVDRPPQHEAFGNESSSSVWTLGTARADGDVVRHPHDYSVALTVSESLGGPLGAEAVWSIPQLADTYVVLRQMIVKLVNAERLRHGCGPLSMDSHLQRSAQSHVDDMALHNYYDHNTREGHTPGDRMRAAGYDWSGWGENLSRGSLDPVATVKSWMTSQGHRRNILNCTWTDTGVGVDLSSTGSWWAQDFAVRR